MTAEAYGRRGWSPPPRVQQFLAVAVLIALAVWRTWPLAQRLSREVWGVIWFKFIHPDVYLTMWIVNWPIQALLSAPRELANAAIFHPALYAQGYTEHMLGVLPVTLPTYLLSGNPVFTHQFLLLMTFVLSGVTMAALLHFWTGSLIGGIVGGAVFAFAPWRFKYAQHLHLLVTLYVPLIILFSSRYLLYGRRRDLLVTWLTLAAQLLCSYALAYPLLAGLVPFWFVHWLGVRAPFRRLLGLACATVAAVAVLGVASIPQVLVRRLGVSDIIPYWNPEESARGSGLPFVSWIQSGSLQFPGYVPVALVLVGVLLLLVVGSRQSLRLSGRVIVLSFAAFLAPLVILTLGPSSPWMAWLWSVVPGLSQYRHAWRFSLLSALPAGVFAGAAIAVLDNAVRSWRSPLRGLVWVAAIALVVYYSAEQRRNGLVIALMPVREVPPVYEWLAQQPAGEGEGLLEVPAGMVAPRGRRYADPEYVYWSLYHHVPLINGYAGYAPSNYPLVLNLAAQLPSADARDTLRRLTGVRWIIVHLRKLTEPERRRWENATEWVPVARFDDDVVFALDPAKENWQASYQVAPQGKTVAGTPLATLSGLGDIEWKVPESIVQNENFPVHLTIRNLGAQPWPALSADPRYRVGLVLRWEPVIANPRAGAPVPAVALNQAPVLMGWESAEFLSHYPSPIVMLIPRDLASKEVATVEGVIASPRRPGSYYLVAELVQGRFTPFVLRDGPASGRVRVEVMPPAPEPEE